MRASEYQQIAGGLAVKTFENHMAQLGVPKDSKGKINLIEMLTLLHRSRAESNMMSGGKSLDDAVAEPSDLPWAERREKADALYAVSREAGPHPRENRQPISSRYRGRLRLNPRFVAQASETPAWQQSLKVQR